jgi:hypothetical protein
MPQYWKFLAFVFALAACSEKRFETANQPSTRPALTSDVAVARSPGLPEHLLPSAVSAAEVPAAQRLPGKLLEGWRWQDTKGENLLVLYRTDERPDVPLDPAARDDPERTVTYDANGDTVTVHGYREYQQQLLARQYVRQPGQAYTELWHLRDEVRHCAFDLDLALLPHTTAITDLDHDGQTETTLLYVTTCRSDVSPDGLKLILHEGAAKYALRGTTVVQVDSIPASQRQPANPCCLGQLSKAQLEKRYEGPIETYMGRYFSEADFKDKPEFLRFARQQWQRYSVFDAAAQAE